MMGWAMLVIVAAVVVSVVSADESAVKPWIWPSSPPADCPFEPSEDIAGIAFTHRHSDYSGLADTWYPSWASDGRLYSPYSRIPFWLSVESQRESSILQILVRDDGLSPPRRVTSIRPSPDRWQTPTPPRRVRRRPGSGFRPLPGSPNRSRRRAARTGRWQKKSPEF